jgi:streptogramin lyase
MVISNCSKQAALAMRGRCSVMIVHLTSRRFSVLVAVLVSLLAVGCATAPETDTSGTMTVAFEHPISSVAVGAGAIWAKGDTVLYRIDPLTGRVDATTSLGKGALAYSELAVTNDAVWALNSEDNTLSRVDPQSLRTVATIPVGDALKLNPYTVVPRFPRMWVGEGSVWVLNHGAGTLTRIDVQDNRAVITIPVGSLSAQWGRNTFPSGHVSIAQGAVWVHNAEGVLRVDPQTNAIVSRLTVGPAEVSETVLWVRDQKQGSLSRVDPRTGRVEATIPVSADSIGPALSKGAAWLFDRRTRIVSRIDLATNNVVGRIALPKLSRSVEKAKLEVHGDSLWIFHDDWLSGIDPENNTVRGTILIYNWLKGYALGEGMVWCITSKGLMSGSDPYQRLNAYRLPGP